MVQNYMFLYTSISAIEKMKNCNLLMIKAKFYLMFMVLWTSVFGRKKELADHEPWV